MLSSFLNLGTSWRRNELTEWSLFLLWNPLFQMCWNMNKYLIYSQMTGLVLQTAESQSWSVFLNRDFSVRNCSFASYLKLSPLQIYKRFVLCKTQMFTFWWFTAENQKLYTVLVSDSFKIENADRLINLLFWLIDWPIDDSVQVSSRLAIHAIFGCFLIDQGD